MKKGLILGITLLSFGLVGCTNTSTSSSSQNSSDTSKAATKQLTNKQVTAIYNTTMNAEADVWSKLTDSIKNNDNEMSDAVNSADTVLTKNEATLKQHKSEDGVSDMSKLVQYSHTLIDDYMGQLKLDKKGNSLISKEALLSQKIRKQFNISAPTKLNTAIKSATKAINTMPGVSGKTIRTTNYTITITSTEITPHFEGGTDLIVYYTFKNTSKNKNIEPTESLIECAHFTQESKTSINDLDLGNPSKDSDEWSSLEKAASQKVKPGAEVKCMGSYELDNTEYPVKIQATDPDNNDAKLGTITLELPNN
ncbi:DUF5067 domain-containing protein [Lactiplantibacillus plantarum]|uniref:DUF5067 domain-containing protein n=1 Tax=Lactiplantibacillus plantarum TaxID=1590 RepID=UPI0018C7B8B5|nr:DUF5067 domain-containing protein [Lactiplantibacillus plantarum]MBG1236805.1 DUF5067 domain-containing protein [Lactiplantibacillus plantarum subsp. plantarum]